MKKKAKAQSVIKTRTYTIEGIVPLIQHNGRMRNPLDPVVKEIKKISKKRNKTDEDHAEIARLEWYGGLYTNEKQRVIVPGVVLQAMLKNAAKKNKLGKQFAAGVFVEEDPLLKYDGPTDIDKLWEDEKFRLIVAVKVQQSAVMRCRPYFPEWGLTFTVTYNSTLVNPEEIDLAVEVAGNQIALLEWRPQHGRFVVKKIA